MAQIPTAVELCEFLSVYERLEKFEVQQRCIRGYGAFDESDLPIPAAQKVIGWLRSMVPITSQPTG